MASATNVIDLPIDLGRVPTQTLLTEVCRRFKEAVFIGHADDKVNPLHLACHFPNKMTGMHGLLVPALERLLSKLKSKYAISRGQDETTVCNLDMETVKLNESIA